MKIIKRERQVKLDELVDYIWKNNIKSKGYSVKMTNKEVRVFEDGRIETYAGISENDLFTITEELEITEDTPINLVYRIKTEKGWQTFDKNETPINRIINTYKRHPHAYLGFIYLQNPDGSIGELIWKDGGLVD